MTTLLTHLQGPWGAALVWFAGVSAVIIFFRKVSKDADEELDPDKRQELADRLSRIRQEGVDTAWIPDFRFVFDRFFGSRHLSWRCFSRSATISFVTFSILFIATWGRGILEIRSFSLLAFYLFAWTNPLFINVGADYISLLETRKLLSSRMSIPWKIAIDAILTYLLTVLWGATVSYTLVVTLWEGLPKYDGTYLDYLRSYAKFGGRSESWGHPTTLIIFITSFTTSIWLWLHGLAQLTIRALGSVQWLTTWLNVKEKPLRAVGTMINVYVVLFSVLLFPLFWLIK